MSIYLLHFSPSYKHAKHYLGYADDIAPRVYAHLHGKGARLTQVATDAGSTLILVRIWEGADRTTERKMKNRSHVPDLCPICCGLVVQMPLLLGEAAYVPGPELEEVAPAQLCHDVADCQLDLCAPDDEQEWQDYFLDVEWLRTGC